MSDAVVIAGINAVPSLVALWFAFRASKHAARAYSTSEEVRKNTNGIKDELVELTKKSSYAAGIIEGAKINFSKAYNIPYEPREAEPKIDSLDD